MIIAAGLVAVMVLAAQGVVDKTMSIGDFVAINTFLIQLYLPCMIHNGFTAEQMDPRFAIITAPEVIDLLMNAKGSLQIT